MRLICPNCDAEYEVDDAAIPLEGRDVQCSACGHAWFQAHPEVEAEAEAEAELYEASDEMEPASAEKADDDAPPPDEATGQDAAEQPDWADDDHEDEPVEQDFADEDLQDMAALDGADAKADLAAVEADAPDMPSAASRGLDASVLAVLKEEADREVTARRAESFGRPGLESQTEMPLSAGQAQSPAAAATAAGSMAAAVKRIAQLRGLATEEPSPSQAPAAEPEAPPPQEPSKPVRRKSLPAIEEINQSLRASGDRGLDGDDAVADTMGEASQRSAFRQGFILLVVLAALIVILYSLAPLIIAKVPVLEPVVQAYVSAVDSVRLAVDGLLKGLIGWMQGMMSGQSG